MTKFLRLFPEFRHLEADLVAAETARIRADDDARIWRSKSDWAESERDKAKVELATVLKQQSNWQALMTGSPHVPFPEVYTPPPAPPPQPEGARQSTRPLTLRDMQRTAVLQSRMAAVERARAAHGDE